MKLSREQLEQDLLAYVEGTLPAEEAARLEIYLANTEPQLAARVAGMMADRKAMQAAPKLRAPADLAERIMERVERTSLLGGAEERAEMGGRRRWYVSRLAMAASLFLVIGVFGFAVVKSVILKPSAWETAGGSGARGPGAHLDKSGDLAMAKGGWHDLDNLTRQEVVAPVVMEQQLAKSVNVVAGVMDKERAGFNETISAKLALENLGVRNRSYQAGPPVVLTLVATNPDDPQRLRQELARMALRDEGVARRQVAANAEDDLALKDAAKAETLNKSGLQGKAPAGGGGGQQLTDQTTAPAATPGRQQQEAVAQGNNFDNKYQQNFRFQDMQRPQVAQRGAEAGEKAVTEAKKAYEVLRYSGEAGAPYRLVLRPEQLDQLVDDFTVVTVARGDNGYVVSGGMVEARNVLRMNGNNDGNVNYNGVVSNGTLNLSNTGTFGNATTNVGGGNTGFNASKTGVDHGALVNGGNSSVTMGGTIAASLPTTQAVQAATPTAGPTPAAPAPAAAMPAPAAAPRGPDAGGRADLRQPVAKEDAGPWVDVVVTMLPGDAPPAATAPNGGVQLDRAEPRQGK